MCSSGVECTGPDSLGRQPCLSSSLNTVLADSPDKEDLGLVISGSVDQLSLSNPRGEYGLELTVLDDSCPYCGLVKSNGSNSSPCKSKPAQTMTVRKEALTCTLNYTRNLSHSLRNPMQEVFKTLCHFPLCFYLTKPQEKETSVTLLFHMVGCYGQPPKPIGHVCTVNKHCIAGLTCSVFFFTMLCCKLVWQYKSHMNLYLRQGINL